MTTAVGVQNLFKVEAGVVHTLLQARYYDGGKGEFLSEDPVGTSAERLMQPGRLHSFGYAGGNPVSDIDP